MSKNVFIPSLKPNNNVVFTKNDENTNYTGIQPIGEVVNPETVTTTVNQSPIGSEVLSVNEIPKSVLIPATTATWLASNYLIDKLNTNLAKDKYEDTCFGKIGAKIDKISENNWFGKKIQSGIDGIGNLYNKAAKNSRILRTLRNFTGRPEWGFAKLPFYGLKGFLGMDLEGNILKDLLSDIAYDSEAWFHKHKLNYQKLEQYGLNNDQIDNFVKSLAGKSKDEKAISLLKKELELLNVDSQELSKAGNDIKKLSELAKEYKFKNLLGLTKQDYEKIAKLIQDEPKEAIKLLKSAIAKNPKLKVSHWRVYSFMGSRKLGKFVSDVFGRKTTWQEYLNKYNVAVGKGAKSSLGKLTTKTLGWITEAHTGRFACGKLFALFAAAEVAKALVHTFKADGIKDKFSTATENFTNTLVPLLGSTLSMLALYKAAGLKYIGMDSKADLANYRNKIHEFNENVVNDAFKDKAEYNNAKKVVEDLLKKKDLKFFPKILQKFGAFLNIGNEHMLKFKGKYSLFNLCKGDIIGYPLRAILVMAVISSWISKSALKLDHSIFGKPKHSVEDEDKEVDETKSSPKDQAQTMIDGKPVNGVQTLSQNSNGNKSDTNLLELYRNNTPKNPTGTTTVVNNTTINNPDSNDTKYAEPARTYIPSSDCTITTNEDLTAGERALLAADATEKNVKMFLESM